jgi:hypothetical protein
MAGTLLNVLPKQVLDFGNIGVGTNQYLVLAERIDISQYIDVVLVLRVHAMSCGAASVMTFFVFPDGWCDEDPTINFISPFQVFTPAGVGGSDVFPTLRSFGGSVSGHYVALVVQGLRGDAGPLSASVSVDLCLRSPDA